MAAVDRLERVWVGTCPLDQGHEMRVIEELSAEAELVPRIELPCDQCAVVPPPNVTLWLVRQ